MTDQPISAPDNPSLLDALRPWLWLAWLVPVAIAANWLFNLTSADLRADWLAREGGHLLTWWVIATAAGAGVWPLLARLLPALPDRGYSVARPAGLMLSGFIFWLAASLGLLQNAVGGIVLAWLVVVVLSGLAWLTWAARPNWAGIRAWTGENLPLIVLVEVLFLVGFVGWAYVQAHNPEITSTEKPMEMAFINGIRNSEAFPPNDPWLAGYAISYYYFGYVITAALADLSSVTTGTAFNLVNALVFALTASGAFGLVYNLVRSAGPLQRWRQGSRAAAVGVGLAGMAMLVLMGNLGTLLVELPYRGYADRMPGGDTLVDADYFAFWDVEDRLESIDRDNNGVIDWDGEAQPFHENVYWWWFRYSRVVQDRDLQDTPIGIQPIAEFPQFSFILADNHPHVLALPFAVLALAMCTGLALRHDPLPGWALVLYAVFLGGMVFMNAWDAVYIVLAIGAEALRRLIRGGAGGLSGFGELMGVLSLNRRREITLLLLGPVLVGLVLLIVVGQVSVFGGMPWWLGLLVALLLTPLVAPLVNWALEDTGWSGVVRFGVLLGLLSYVLYLPWYISFTSQANGFYPNIIFPTAWQQFVLQFGIFVLTIGLFVGIEIIRHRHTLNWYILGGVVIGGVLLTLLVPLVSTWALDTGCPLTAGQEAQLSQLEDTERSACEARQRLFGGLKRDNENLYQDVIWRRMGALPSQLFLLVVAGFGAARLFSHPPRDARYERHYPPGYSVALLLMAAGAVLAFLPDIFYVRDVFSFRINTIFKLYYQAWLLFAIASAYAIYALFNDPPRLAVERLRPAPAGLIARRLILGAVIPLLLWMGLLYPYYAIRSRAVYEAGRNPEQVAAPRPLTLAGERTIIGPLPEGDFEAVQCLAALEPYGSPAVVAEAPFDGGYWASVPPYGRASTLTGLPTLMGWANHERQWRGDSYVEIDGVGAGQRFTDLDRLYTSTEWVEAQQIIDKYGIDYVIVGHLERHRYNTEGSARGLDKFAELFDPVCQSGETAIYYVSRME